MMHARVAFVMATFIACSWCASPQADTGRDSQAEPQPEQRHSPGPPPVSEHASLLQGEALPESFNQSSEKIRRLLPQRGFIVAQYSTPVLNSPDNARARLILALDVPSNAWLVCHELDGKVYGRNTHGVRISGYAAPQYVSTAGVDNGRPDDTIIEPFVPHVALRDVLSRSPSELAPEAFFRLDGGHRIIVNLFEGSRSLRQPGQVGEIRRTTFDIDRNGRLISVSRDGVRRTFTYLPESPAPIWLADPAHGGGWRLDWYQFSPDCPPDWFEPRHIEATLALHGFQLTEDELRFQLTRDAQAQREAP
ncbi:MAG TPA: hypothetical protein VNL69_01285 [Bacteroidota bacterium]|nr:hypothetical protein [Bacteroidota bacterium]